MSRASHSVAASRRAWSARGDVEQAVAASAGTRRRASRRAARARARAACHPAAARRPARRPTPGCRAPPPRAGTAAAGARASAEGGTRFIRTARRGVYCAPLGGCLTADRARSEDLERTRVREPSPRIAVASAAARAAHRPAFQAAPTFEVDPLWPKPLPNHWLLGSVTGVAVDAQDHIWVVHRGYDSMTARTEIGAATNPKTADECCVPAPPVLEFDAAGNLISHWGWAGPGDKYDWPVSPGGIAVDAQGQRLDRGGRTAGDPRQRQRRAGRARPRTAATTAAPLRRRRTGAGAATTAPPKPQDAHVLKFSRKGEFLLQIGKAGAPGGNDSTTALNRPAGVDVDRGRQRGLRRRRLRQPPRRRLRRRDRRLQAALGADRGRTSSRTVSCVEGRERRHRLRLRSRQQPRPGVRQDRQVPEAGRRRRRTRAAPARCGTSRSRAIRSSGSCSSPTATIRKSSSCAATRSRPSAASATAAAIPGTFYSVGSVAVDSRGNVYTGETLEGKRVQKFVPKGAGR